ncbi:MAG: imidazole glycerol phosphate synthase subunit HisH [candidate division NC10 bacterium]
MIAIVDYGRGNLRSVEKAFVRLGMETAITQDPAVVRTARALVLPGDGAFHDAMQNLDRLGLLSPIKESLEAGRPFLGICLGYQLLFSESEEWGVSKGLDLLPGVVRRFPKGLKGPEGARELKVPHMGWNQVMHSGDLAIFDGIPSGACFYFVHSYYPEPLDGTLRVATCHYGITFPAAIGKGKLFATQFHPEKSQRWGLALLENFAGIVRAYRP